MLSVLIPVYNYNIVELVNEIHSQLSRAKISYEIICLDDSSTQHYIDNFSINELPNCSFVVLENNIGRSAIRNLLASSAKYDQLLFIDAGTFPKSDGFINNYLNSLNKQVVNGGMTQLEQSPKKPYKLRWLYTKKRESNFKNGKVFCSSNFMIKKEVFVLYPFDESIKKYGYEDVVFVRNLTANNIRVSYIDNPVIHDSKDDADTFIRKSEDALENLIQLVASNKLSIDAYKITRMHKQIQKLKLVSLVVFMFSRSRNLLLKNFNSSYPSIFLFDFYRLGYYCLLTKKR